MVDTVNKVGLISCSGEEIPEGTVSRNAVRRVLESLRPGRTVTLCLPLFLAGGEEERAFARNHPVVAVDGCPKRCAKRGTEMHSGPVRASRRSITVSKWCFTAATLKWSIARPCELSLGSQSCWPKLTSTARSRSQRPSGRSQTSRPLASMRSSRRTVTVRRGT